MSDPLAAGLVAERLAAVRDRVGLAALEVGRDPSTVRLLAVTKGQPLAAVAVALSLGLHDIGESRVQEAEAKHAALQSGEVRWHMIGHLQRNKARVAASLFEAVHSVDSVALARALDRHREDVTPPLQVFIEVELTGLPGRTGVTAADAPALLATLLTLRALAPVGLMTVAAPGPSAVAAECFARLHQLRDRLRQSHDVALPELSMGMSEDFETAVAQGATVIRLGRALFGDRTVGSGDLNPRLS